MQIYRWLIINASSRAFPTFTCPPRASLPPSPSLSVSLPPSLPPNLPFPRSTHSLLSRHLSLHPCVPFPLPHHISAPFLSLSASPASGSYMGVEFAGDDEHAPVVGRHFRHRHPDSQRLGRAIRRPPVAVRAVPAAAGHPSPRRAPQSFVGFGRRGAG